MEEIVEEEEDITTRTSTEDQVGRSLIVMLGRREEVLGVDVREDQVGNECPNYLAQSSQSTQQVLIRFANPVTFVFQSLLIYVIKPLSSISTIVVIHIK